MSQKLILGLAGAGAVAWYLLKNAKAALPAGQTVTAGGRSWILRVVPTDAVGMVTTDVYAPAGSWGPHAEMRVIRFTQVPGPSNPRMLAGAGEGVPVAMRDAAIAAFGVKILGT